MGCVADDFSGKDGILNGGESGEIVGPDGLQISGIECSEIFCFSDGEGEGTFFVLALEEPGVAVVANHAVRADDLVQITGEPVLAGLSVGKGGFRHGMGSIRQGDMRPDMIRSDIGIGPCPEAGPCHRFGAGPESQQIDEMDTAVDERTAFQHPEVSPFIVSGRHIRAIFSMAVPIEDEAHGPYGADCAGPDGSADLG